MNNNLLFCIAIYPLLLRRTWIATVTSDHYNFFCFADTMVLVFATLAAFLTGIITAVAGAFICWKRFKLLLTGWERLIRSHLSARFCFELSGNSN